MDELKLAPIIRGACIEIGTLPPIVLFKKEDGKSDSSLEGFSLDINKLSNDSNEAVGEYLKNVLQKAREADGTLPAVLKVSRMGSFFIGENQEEARKAQEGKKVHFNPLSFKGRNDAVRGRVALVTGAAQGFGALIARRLAEEGSFVCVADINGEGARALAETINTEHEKKAFSVEMDVSNESSVREAIDILVRETGGLDLVVSNAGVLRAGSLLDFSKENFDFVTNVNYTAFFLIAKHTAPVMMAQNAGCPDWKTDIVQINSKSGLQGSNKNAAYAGGKFGSIGLVQSFALELVNFGIKVNAVCPGNFFEGPLWSDPEKGLFAQYLRAGKVPGAQSMEDVKTFYEDKVPMKRGCGGEDVLRAILYCVEQRYETGQAIPVTGGQIMLG